MRGIRLGMVVVWMCLAITAGAQLGLRGQIYLPNGEALHRIVRYTLSTNDGSRNDTLFTDSNGRIEINTPVTVPYSITVPGDGETYDTTTAFFDPAYSGRYILVHLKPHSPKPSHAPGVVDASKTEQAVSPKAKELYDQAVKLVGDQKYQEAVEPLKQAIAIQPDFFRAYNDLGVLNMRLNRLDQAEDAFRHAIKIDSRSYLPQLNLGIVLNRRGSYKDAAEVLRKLQLANPDVAERINAALVEALIGSQQWALAEQQLEKALHFENVDAVDLKIKLGMVLIKQGKSASAIGILDEAARAEPDNPLAQFNLGAALLDANKLDQAESALRRAYEIKGAEMAGAQLLLGQLYFQKKDYPRAVDAFKTYLHDLPGAPNAAQVREAIEKLSQPAKK
ncbi:MAG TPA: tetratricopeptide repeat protein [Blastocatellia bacterium]|nr:tetratricopeptide repeat protein [Blastocatellia bacterium]